MILIYLLDPKLNHGFFFPLKKDCFTINVIQLAEISFQLSFSQLDAQGILPDTNPTTIIYQFKELN